MLLSVQLGPVPGDFFVTEDRLFLQAFVIVVLAIKDRRRVVRSYKDRLRARLPVSVAEVGDVDRYQVATLGLAVISADAARCQQVLAQAANMAATLHHAQLADVATEIVSFGRGGSGVRGGIEQAFGPEEFEDGE